MAHHVAAVGDRAGLSLGVEGETGCTLPKAWLDVAYVQRMRLDVAGERDALEQGLKVDPALEDTIFKLAALHERNGEFEKSLALLETACTQAPLQAGVHGGAADMLWKLGRRTEALDWIQHALRLNPDYEWGWDTLREWAPQANQPALPEQLARDLTGCRGGEARPWLMLAQALARADQWVEAASAVGTALLRGPRFIEAHLFHADLLCRQQRFEEARRACAPEVFASRIPHELRARAAWISAE